MGDSYGGDFYGGAPRQILLDLSPRMIFADSEDLMNEASNSGASPFQVTPRHYNRWCADIPEHSFRPMVSVIQREDRIWGIPTRSYLLSPHSISAARAPAGGGIVLIRGFVGSYDHGTRTKVGV